MVRDARHCRAAEVLMFIPGYPAGFNSAFAAAHCKARAAIAYLTASKM